MVFAAQASELGLECALNVRVLWTPNSISFLLVKLTKLAQLDMIIFVGPILGFFEQVLVKRLILKGLKRDI